jgi:cytochrome c556
VRRLFFAAALAFLAVPAVAADDPVAVRKALMSSVGAAAAMSGGVLKGEIAYAPAIGASAIATMAAASVAYADFFPEGSDGDPRSAASPKIWEDRAGFLEQVAKFQAATAAAVTASGRNGPADAEAFKAAVEPILGTCRSCHESYQVRK